MENAKHQRIIHDENSTIQLTRCKNVTNLTEHDVMQQIKEVGAKIKVKWTSEEVGDSGWKPGFYTATVQSYDESSDMLVIVYTSEPDCTYTIELTPNFTSKNIKLVQAVI